jgi:hypothetical protein
MTWAYRMREGGRFLQELSEGNFFRRRERELELDIRV